LARKATDIPSSFTPAALMRSASDVKYSWNGSRSAQASRAISSAVSSENGVRYATKSSDVGAKAALTTRCAASIVATAASYAGSS